MRNLSISHASIGKVLAAKGDLPTTVKHERTALGIREQLVRMSPANLEWQRSLLETLVTLHEMTDDVTYLRRAVPMADTLQRRGLLEPEAVDELKRRAG